MYKFLGPFLVIAGGVLLYYGYQAKESVGSQLDELVSGTPSDNAMLYLIGGGIAVVLGLGMTVSGNRKR